MLSRRDSVLTVVVQGVGALATMAITVVVAQRFGPAGQGFWARFKSVVDFVGVVAAYGFPVGFPFLINVRGVSDIGLLRFSLLYGVVLIPAVALGVVTAWYLGIVHLSSPIPAVELGLVTVTSVALALHSLLRGLTLATASTLIFNVVTAIPPSTLCVLVVLWPLESAYGLMWLASSAAVVTLVVCLGLWFAFRSPATSAIVRIPILELVTFGGWNFAVSVALVFVPVATYQMLAMSGVPSNEIGWFSVAVLIQGALLTPANMLGPVLYNAWTQVRDVEHRKESYGRLHRLAFVWSVGTVVVVLFALKPVLPWIIGDGFDPTISLARILLVTVPIGYWTRLMANILLATGAVRLYAFSALGRLLSVLTVLSMLRVPNVRSAAFAWVIGEGVAALVCLLGLVYALGWSWKEALGAPDIKTVA